MKILIIKTGQCETFHFSDSAEVISLGDVLRSTVLLHLFKNDQIYWICSPQAAGLIEGISGITVATDNSEFAGKHFDLIINLERHHSLDGFQYADWVGFNGHQFKTSEEVKNLNSWLYDMQRQNKNWSEKLFLLLGKSWNGENYLLPEKYSIKTDGQRIGLNWKVGVKWPSKSWPFESWTMLSKKLENFGEYSWQEGFFDLDEYIRWLNSCDLIVTHDSLGLHLALALQKKIVALFGSTSSSEIHGSDKAVFLNKKNDSEFACVPCYKAACDQKNHCVEKISVDEVFQAITKLRERHE